MRNVWVTQFASALLILALSASAAWGQEVSGDANVPNSGESPEPEESTTTQAGARPVDVTLSSPTDGGRPARMPADFSFALGLTPMPGADLAGMVTRRTGVHAVIGWLPALGYLLELGPRYYFSLRRTSGYVEGGLMLVNARLFFFDERVQAVGGSAAVGVEHQFRARITLAAAGGVYVSSAVVPLVRLMFGYRF